MRRLPEVFILYCAGKYVPVFGMHIIIKYYLLHVYRNKRANNQVFLVTTAERVEEVIADADHSGDWIHRLASIAIIDETRLEMVSWCSCRCHL